MQNRFCSGSTWEGSQQSWDESNWKSVITLVNVYKSDHWMIILLFPYVEEEMIHSCMFLLLLTARLWGAVNLPSCDDQQQQLYVTNKSVCLSKKAKHLRAQQTKICLSQFLPASKSRIIGYNCARVKMEHRIARNITLKAQGTYLQCQYCKLALYTAKSSVLAWSWNFWFRVMRWIILFCLESYLIISIPDCTIKTKWNWFSSPSKTTS